jgi:LEA14-like dessication related protein
MNARRLALPLAAAGLAACASHQPRPPANVPVLTPHVTFQSATVVGATFEGVELLVAMEVENPNAFALPVVRLAHAVTVDGQPAFSAVASASAAVPSGGTFPVLLPLVLPYGRIPAIGERLVAGRPIAYAVTGSVGLQTPAGVVDLPVGWEGTLPLPRRPEFAFEGVEVGVLSALSLSFDVKLRVSNPNAFRLPGGLLGHRVSVAGTAVASGDQKLPGLEAGATAVVLIPCQVNPFGVGAGAARAVYEALQGNEIPVALLGRATLAGIPVDLALESRIPRLR